MNNTNNPFLNELLTEIKETYSGYIIEIYGIGTISFCNLMNSFFF